MPSFLKSCPAGPTNSTREKTGTECLTPRGGQLGVSWEWDGEKGHKQDRPWPILRRGHMVSVNAVRWLTWVWPLLVSSWEGVWDDDDDDDDDNNNNNNNNNDSDDICLLLHVLHILHNFIYSLQYPY